MHQQIDFIRQSLKAPFAGYETVAVSGLRGLPKTRDVPLERLHRFGSAIIVSVNYRCCAVAWEILVNSIQKWEMAKLTLAIQLFNLCNN
jgi:hypothetical protein